MGAPDSAITRGVRAMPPTQGTELKGGADWLLNLYKRSINLKRSGIILNLAKLYIEINTQCILGAGKTGEAWGRGHWVDISLRGGGCWIDNPHGVPNILGTALPPGNNREKGKAERRLEKRKRKCETLSYSFHFLLFHPVLRVDR